MAYYCSELRGDSEVSSQSSVIASGLVRALVGLGGWCHMLGVPGSISGRVVRTLHYQFIVL